MFIRIDHSNPEHLAAARDIMSRLAGEHKQFIGPRLPYKYQAEVDAVRAELNAKYGRRDNLNIGRKV